MRLGNWGRLLAPGLAAGTLINAAEWAAHRVWLKQAWTDAFAALGRTPTGWSAFIAANFLVGAVAVWGYQWLSNRYGHGFRTALRTGIVAWIVFWVIPTLAVLPLRLFPDHLLALTMLVGLGAVPAAILGAWLYEGMKWPAAFVATTGAFRHSGRRKGITTENNES